MTSAHKWTLALIGISFALSAAVFLWLPAQMPSHWNLAGEVDATLPKVWGAFLLPLVMAGLYVLFRAIPMLSPDEFRIENSDSAFSTIVLAVLALLAVLNAMVLLQALGVAFSMTRAVLICVGALLAAIGWVLDRVPRNFYVGIRTPWAIVDPDNWTKTHRFGKWAFLAGGLGLCAAGVLDWGIAAIIGFVILATLSPLIYSFVIYKRRD